MDTDLQSLFCGLIKSKVSKVVVVYLRFEEIHILEKMSAGNVSGRKNVTAPPKVMRNSVRCRNLSISIGAKYDHYYFEADVSAWPNLDYFPLAMFFCNTLY